MGGFSLICSIINDVERWADDTELAPLGLGCEEPLLSTGLTVGIWIRAWQIQSLAPLSLHWDLVCTTIHLSPYIGTWCIPQSLQGELGCTSLSSPRYNHTGWLGVRHQVTYLPVSPQGDVRCTLLLLRQWCMKTVRSSFTGRFPAVNLLWTRAATARSPALGGKARELDALAGCSVIPVFLCQSASY